KMIKAASMRELREAMATLSGYPGELMLSEYIPGDDTCGANYNSFRHGGEVVAEFTARKVRLKPSRIGFPTVVRSTRLEEVLEAGRGLLSGMDFSGFSCMELKKDARDGVYKLMEVNARHNFSGMLALACGVNFPWLSYAQAIGAEVNPQPSTWREDVYWIDEERDLKGLLKSLRRPAAARAYAEPYRRRPVYAVWSAADPGPSLRLAAETLRHAAGRALRL